MIYSCAKCGKAKNNKTGYCAKCNKEYCNNHYHTRQKVSRERGMRNEYARNQNVPAKILHDVVVKCPNCEKLRTVKRTDNPSTMPRVYCSRCEYLRYGDDQGYGYIGKENHRHGANA